LGYLIIKIFYMAKIKDGAKIWPAKTYLLGRRCQYCGEPIEDQARANKIHCSSWVDEYGVKHDCKRRKNMLKNRTKEDTLLDLCARHRETNRQIERIIAAHGDLVSTEVLNAYNVNLADNISFSYDSGIATAEFLGFRIKSNPILKNHKIERYEQLSVPEHGSETQQIG
jgi:hypothetical protein